MEQRKPSRIDPAYRPPKPERIGASPTPKINPHIPAPKPMKDKIIKVILNQIWYFIRTWLYAKPVYVTAPDEHENIVPIRNPETGKKKVNIPLTLLGRVVQLLGVVGWLPLLIAGKPVSEWLELLQKLIEALSN